MGRTGAGCGEVLACGGAGADEVGKSGCKDLDSDLRFCRFGKVENLIFGASTHAMTIAACTMMFCYEEIEKDDGNLKGLSFGCKAVSGL